MAFADDVKTFIKSSSYQFGDRTGFSVNLAPGLTLPGKCGPGSYLDGLELDKVPEKVLVICPGNGGLAVELFARGAKQVTALEPRSRFNKGIQGVKRLLDTYWRLEEIHDCDLLWHPHWPKVGRGQGLKDFDLILWPEGVEEITSPKETFQSVADCLAPGGKLIVELTHGNHQWVEKINSWRPTGHAVVDMSNAIFGGPPTTKKGGRNTTSAIYTLTLPGKTKTAAKPKSTAKPKPKKEESKEETPAIKKPATPPPAPPAPEEPKAEAPKTEDLMPDEAVKDAVVKPEAPRETHVDLSDKPAATGIKISTLAGSTLDLDDTKPVEKAPEPKAEAPKKTAKKKKKKTSKKTKPKADGADN